MSRGPENTFIASVHRLLPKSIYALKNHNEYNGGIADVWYDGPKGDLWVEYKFITVPKRDDTLIKIDLSKLQLQWLKDRYNNGRNVAVVVGCKDGGVWIEDCYWEESMTVTEFQRLCIHRQELVEQIVRHCDG